MLVPPRQMRPIHTTRSAGSAHLAGLLLTLAVTSCGGVDDGTSRTGAPSSSDPEEEPSTKDITLEVDTSERFQTLEGFGASVAWYVEWLAEHPNADELYDLLYVDLGADILRIRNTYQRENEWEGFAPGEASIIEGANERLKQPLRVLISSWSPPPSLKDNGATRCDNVCDHGGADCVPAKCTLIKDDDGDFAYAGFADYWAESLEAYAELGIEPDYVSIQNEPDFLPDGWEGCRFNPTEGGGLASYTKALETTAARIEALELDKPPRLLGPETLGVHGDRVIDYAAELDLDTLYGVAHHLYEGEQWRAPEGYAPWLRKIAANYDELPIFQTEFGEGDGFETAWLIHTALVEANASAYLYWELIWAGRGLISLSNPFDEDNFTDPGYQVMPQFHAMRHYARYTDPGYARVAVEINSDEVRATAFLAPDESRLTVVLLNPDVEEHRVNWDLSEFEAEDFFGFMTVADDEFQPISDLEIDGELELPIRSVVTLVAER